MSNERRSRFHERFQIDVGADEAKRRFVNRCFTYIFDHVSDTLDYKSTYGIDLFSVHSYVAFVLGERFNYQQDFHDWVGNDFWRCLQVLEAVYDALPEDDPYSDTGAKDISDRIQTVLHSSELDIGVSWQPPVFVRTGAGLLDEHLVNEPLRWLSEPKYELVRKPFEKGLSHYLEAETRPDRLADAVTDMYEAVEALAKVVTGNDKDLSGNREAFVKRIKASDYYKQSLKDYIKYANEFRHAQRLRRSKPSLSEPEVEAFIYLTGLFIRLAIRQS